jgi:uncharacterized protein YukE
MPDRREAIQELREKANQLQQVHENVDDLLGELARNMQRLSEDWKNPAVAEIQSIVAGVIRQTRSLNETLGALARKFHAGADEAEEDERRQANSDDAPQGAAR